MPIVRILPSSSAAHAEVAFAYDREIVGVVRAMRTSRWLPRQKRWRVERRALDALLAELDRHGITVDLRPLQPPPQGRHQAWPRSRRIERASSRTSSGAWSCDGIRHARGART
jgi:hypothetical protein